MYIKPLDGLGARAYHGLPHYPSSNGHKSMVAPSRSWRAPSRSHKSSGHLSEESGIQRVGEVGIQQKKCILQRNWFNLFNPY